MNKTVVTIRDPEEHHNLAETTDWDGTMLLCEEICASEKTGE